MDIVRKTKRSTQLNLYYEHCTLQETESQSSLSIPNYSIIHITCMSLQKANHDKVHFLHVQTNRDQGTVSL